MMGGILHPRAFPPPSARKAGPCDNVRDRDPGAGADD